MAARDAAFFVPERSHPDFESRLSMTTITAPSAGKASHAAKAHTLKGKMPAIFFDGEAGTTGL